MVRSITKLILAICIAKSLFISCSEVKTEKIPTITGIIHIDYESDYYSSRALSFSALNMNDQIGIAKDLRLKVAQDEAFVKVICESPWCDNCYKYLDSPTINFPWFLPLKLFGGKNNGDQLEFNYYCEDNIIAKLNFVIRKK